MNERPVSKPKGSQTRSIYRHVFARFPSSLARVLLALAAQSATGQAFTSIGYPAARLGFVEARHMLELAIMPANGNMVSFTKVILPAVLASFVPAYLFWDLERNRHVFGGGPALSYGDKAWGKETLSKFDSGWEREAGTPVVMNPISRGNFHKV